MNVIWVKLTESKLIKKYVLYKFQGPKDEKLYIPALTEEKPDLLMHKSSNLKHS